MSENTGSGRQNATPDDTQDTLTFDGAFMRRGFTQVPNGLIETTAVSMGARMTLIALMSFAWKGNPFPGQERLGAMLGVSERTIREYLTELKAEGFLTVSRRGRGKTNVYRIVQQRLLVSAAESAGIPDEDVPDDRKQGSALDRKHASAPSSKKTKSKEHEVSKPSRAVAAPAEYDPEKGCRVEGRDLPWDALEEVIDTTEEGHGPRMSRALSTIRRLAWREALQAGATLERVRAAPDEYEALLGQAILWRGRKLRTDSPGLTWGPEGIARNWRRAGAMGVSNTEELAAAAVRRAREEQT